MEDQIISFAVIVSNVGMLIMVPSFLAGDRHVVALIVRNA
jgi:hypothetical protein